MPTQAEKAMHKSIFKMKLRLFTFVAAAVTLLFGSVLSADVTGMIAGGSVKASVEINTKKAVINGKISAEGEGAKINANGFVGCCDANGVYSNISIELSGENEINTEISAPEGKILCRSLIAFTAELGNDGWNVTLDSQNMYR